MPCNNKNAFIGLIEGPMSLIASARIRVAKALGPNSSQKLIQEKGAYSSVKVGYFFEAPQSKLPPSTTTPPIDVP